MRLDAFDYRLPERLIAQQPGTDRSGSRLLVVDRVTGARAHRRFRDLPEFMRRGDVLVVNRSRVIPARIFLKRASGGKVELLVVRLVGDKECIALGRPLGKLRAGETLRGIDGEFACEVGDRKGEREIYLKVTSPHTVMDILDAWGHVPLPPYISRPDERADRDRYQTVFAREAGSVAAPTAGLHFDEVLLRVLGDIGVEVCSLVLHVGLGTFAPLEHDVLALNRLHSEAYTVSGQTLAAVRRAKETGARVIAVGTTVTRVLETAARQDFFGRPDVLRDYAGETSLFIYPGFEFNVIDGLITNFHLPRTSLLALVCAFLGRETTLDCYREAIEREYRFFSYGDAMLVS
jgi:S-adenosylmethionine:tRNA ribosyltransferase-isomerase